MIDAVEYALDRRDLAIRILRVSSNAGEGHIPSALSILDVVNVYYRFHRPLRNEKGAVYDEFVLSKGHGSLAIYAVLERLGVLSSEDLNTFCRSGSKLGGHPDRTKVPGIVASTGSLGHGLPFGVGLALAEKLTGQNGEIYTLIGDGEANEGSIWEAALIAGEHQLSNLVCIVDQNSSSDRAIQMNSMSAKFEAFGWKAFEIDGHNPNEILGALNQCDPRLPTAVIANTTKGFGFRMLENSPAWHHRSPTKTEVEEIIMSSR